MEGLGCGNNNALFSEVRRYINLTPRVALKHEFAVSDECDKPALNVAEAANDLRLGAYDAPLWKARVLDREEVA